jgi:catechol 2,3-dioxygenase-like lactoylglutathione lyase family enzyme
MSQKVAIERVDHIGIRVRDLDRALNFYRVLGFDLLRGPKATTLRSSETETASN